ncbi:hypothetical protein P167DRAFT_45463 [Morchella conica CCBAS932]|uniref:Uncharacterized protein n=1 Tax=Morchella conica CCBAS932 TaxID=1392247 RepID=A0A3N4KW85_9PEZI|nr:hypothetical protein P167DRAFT_45463 [Morchella conica CCBAS932]
MRTVPLRWARPLRMMGIYASTLALAFSVFQNFSIAKSLASFSHCSPSVSSPTLLRTSSSLSLLLQILPLYQLTPSLPFVMQPFQLIGHFSPAGRSGKTGGKTIKKPRYIYCYNIDKMEKFSGRLYTPLVLLSPSRVQETTHACSVVLSRPSHDITRLDPSPFP